MIGKMKKNAKFNFTNEEKGFFCGNLILRMKDRFAKLVKFSSHKNFLTIK